MKPNPTFGDQTSRTTNPGGMELHEFHILQRKSSADNHRIAISRAGVRTRATEVRPPIPSSRQHRLVCSESVKFSVFHVEGNDAQTFAILHDDVQSKIFDEKVGVVTERLTVEGEQKCMASTIRSSSTSIRLPALPVLQRMASNRPLVYLAFLRT
jgi:hypothetical protein